MRKELFDPNHIKIEENGFIELSLFCNHAWINANAEAISNKQDEYRLYFDQLTEFTLHFIDLDWQYISKSKPFEIIKLTSEGLLFKWLGLYNKKTKKIDTSFKADYINFSNDLLLQECDDDKF